MYRVIPRLALGEPLIYSTLHGLPLFRRGFRLLFALCCTLGIFRVSLVIILPLRLEHLFRSGSRPRRQIALSELDEVLVASEELFVGFDCVELSLPTPLVLELVERARELRLLKRYEAKVVLAP